MPHNNQRTVSQEYYSPHTASCVLPDAFCTISEEVFLRRRPVPLAWRTTFLASSAVSYYSSFCLRLEFPRSLDRILDAGE